MQRVRFAAWNATGRPLEDTTPFEASDEEVTKALLADASLAGITLEAVRAAILAEAAEDASREDGKQVSVCVPQAHRRRLDVPYSCQNSNRICHSVCDGVLQAPGTPVRR